MEPLSLFFAKYRSLEPPQASVARLVCAAIRDECGITLGEKEIRIVQGGVQLSCHPVVRSEIALCAPRVLATIRSVHGIRLSFLR